MSSQYAGIAARALAMIARKGAAITFLDTGTEPTYDEATDTWSGGTPAEVVGRAVQIPDDPRRFALLGLVISDPVTLIVGASGLGTTPTPGKLMAFGSRVYTIRNVEPVAPSGEPIIYTVIGAG